MIVSAPAARSTAALAAPAARSTVALAAPAARFTAALAAPAASFGVAPVAALRGRTRVLTAWRPCFVLIQVVPSALCPGRKEVPRLGSLELGRCNVWLKIVEAPLKPVAFNN
eukprot:1193062-Prorocentrum_minimum.AAC.2